MMLSIHNCSHLPPFLPGTQPLILINTVMHILPLVDFTISLKCIKKIQYTIIHLLYLLTHRTAPLSRCAGGWGKQEGMNVGKGREKGKVMYNKIRNQNKLKGNVKWTYKNISCNQILDSGIYYSTVGYLIKQLLSETQNRICKHPTAEHQSEK